jgi:hypothetical protein
MFHFTYYLLPLFHVANLVKLCSKSAATMEQREYYTLNDLNGYGWNHCFFLLRDVANI